MASYKALVVGSTGAIGEEVVKELLSSPKCEKVVAFVRQGKSVPNVDNAHPKLAKIEVDFDNLQQHQEAFQGLNAVFCCLGTTIKTAGSQDAQRKVDYEYIVNSARLAKESNVPHFSLVSSGGANAKSAFFYPRLKGETEEACKSTGFRQLSIFQPSLLLTLHERPERRMGEAIAQSVMPWFNWVLPAKAKPIRVDTVARAMRLDFEKRWEEGSLAPGNAQVSVFSNDTIHEMGSQK